MGVQILATRTLRNTGDAACLPHLYIPALAGARVLWLGDESTDPDGLLVVGGGGLLRSGKVERLLLRSLASHRGPRVLWGAGTNEDWVGASCRLPAWLGREFNLIGVRDAVCGVDWVPCCSCLSGDLDAAPAPTVPLVVYHGAERVPGVDSGVPQASCEDGLSMAEAVRFLSSGAVVVTSSYHGWYWSTLLGRRVVVVPSLQNTKFFSLPVLSAMAINRSEWPKMAENPDKIASFPGFLSRCRNANWQFLADLKNNFKDFL